MCMSPFLFCLLSLCCPLLQTLLAIIWVASSGKAGGMSQAGLSGSGNLHLSASQDNSPALSKVDVISLLVNCSLGEQQQS